MNYLEYLVNRIKRVIPHEILVKAFPPAGNGMGMYSMEDRIIQDVLMDVVYADMNLLGGSEHVINISSIQPIETEHSYIYKIPLSLTGGKRILSVLSVNLPEDGSSMGGLYGAINGPSVMASSKIALTGINTVEIRENVSKFNLFLRCRLGLEPNFMDWDARSIQRLGDFAEQAARMICYTRISILMGDGAINSGTINSYLRSHLDEMSDAHQIYKDLMNEQGRKLSIFRDPETRRQVTQMIMPTFL